MSGALSAMALAVGTVAAAYLFYRLARGLGFLETAEDKQHQYRRAIVLALYALLLFLPVLFYGFERRWQRAWLLFGIATALALIVFGAIGVWSAVALWRLRHTDIADGGDRTED